MTVSRQMVDQVLRRLRLGISAEQLADKLEWSIDFINKIESSAIQMNADKIIGAYSKAVEDLRIEGSVRTGRMDIRTRLASNLLANEPLLNDREYIVIQGFFLTHPHETPPTLPEDVAAVFYGPSNYPDIYLNSDVGHEIMRRAYNSGRTLGLPAMAVTATPPSSEIDLSSLFGAEQTLTLRLKMVQTADGRPAIRLERALG